MGNTIFRHILAVFWLVIALTIFYMPITALVEYPKRVHHTGVSGTVTRVNRCTPFTITTGSRWSRVSETKYNCNLAVSYSVDGVQKYKQNFMVKNSVGIINVGDPIQVYYNNANPDEVTDVADEYFSRITLIFFLLLGFILLLLAFFGLIECITNECPNLDMYARGNRWYNSGYIFPFWF